MVLYHYVNIYCIIENIVCTIGIMPDKDGNLLSRVLYVLITAKWLCSALGHLFIER